MWHYDNEWYLQKTFISIDNAPVVSPLLNVA